MTTPRVTVPVEPTPEMVEAAAGKKGVSAYRAMLSAAPAPEGWAVPDDVRRLVIAARNVAFDTPTQSELRALDIASEAFASRVPWEDEPEAIATREEAPEDNVTILITKAHRDAARNSGKKLNDWIGGVLQRAVEESPAEAGEVNLGWFAGFARKHGHHVQADWLDKYRAQPPAREDGDEAYDLGKRDGYEQAVQDVDLLTGGDGEYVFATDGGGCPDAEAMKARIVDRFQAREDAQPLGCFCDEADCPACSSINPAPDALRVAVEALKSIRMMRSDRKPGSYPKTYKGGFDAASDVVADWAAKALAALQAEQGAK